MRIRSPAMPLSSPEMRGQGGSARPPRLPSARGCGIRQEFPLGSGIRQNSRFAGPESARRFGSVACSGGILFSSCVLHFSRERCAISDRKRYNACANAGQQLSFSPSSFHSTGYSGSPRPGRPDGPASRRGRQQLLPNSGPNASRNRPCSSPAAWARAESSP
jgi:hypothetical protein